jgi:23S rRNA (cytidine1920-2'-O)/16S rRNA (cytidine1409-2'-O)-methyltransferase
VVVDVSFISLTLVLPEVIQYLKESARVLALVKPQFEVGREGLGKNGIVKDVSLYGEVEAKMRRCCEANGLTVEDYFASPIEGTDGNREFFVLARHQQMHFGLGAAE